MLLSVGGLGGVDEGLSAFHVAFHIGFGLGLHFVGEALALLRVGFDGKPAVIVKVSDGINKPDELIDRILAGDARVYHHAGGANAAAAEDEAGESAGRKIYKHLMEGVSHMRRRSGPSPLPCRRPR